MKNANLIPKSWTFLALVTLSLPICITGRLAAQSSQPAADTYTWSGELVSLDEGARILTVKARVVGDQPMTQLPKFKVGEDRKSTRLNSSHTVISYAVFCLKKKNRKH